MVTILHLKFENRSTCKIRRYLIKFEVHERIILIAKNTIYSRKFLKFLGNIYNLTKMTESSSWPKKTILNYSKHIKTSKYNYVETPRKSFIAEISVRKLTLLALMKIQANRLKALRS